MSDPVFLTVDEVDELHAETLARFGGSPGIRDRALLESAVATAKAGLGGEFLHPTFFDMAAAYAFHLAESRPFVDGNQRTALAAALVFLALNDVQIEDPEPEQMLYQGMVAVARGAISKGELAKLLRELARSPR